MDKKQYKKGNNKAPWIIGHLVSMIDEGFLSSDGTPQDPPIDKDKINSLVAELKEEKEIKKNSQMLAHRFVITLKYGNVALTVKMKDALHGA